MGPDGVIFIGKAFLRDRDAHGAHEVAMRGAEDFDGVWTDKTVLPELEPLAGWRSE